MVRTALIQLLALALALFTAQRAHRWTTPPAFLAPRAAAVGEPPLFVTEFLPTSGTNFVHGGTFAELPNHDLLAAWYGGTDEIDPDVAIFISRQDHRTGEWSRPRPLENRAAAEEAMGFRVKSVGNPVLSADAHGVRLFYVAVIVGGWSGSTICVKSSPDGERWAPARRLVTSPFLNAGMLVRSAPVPYSDGTVALPIYHELRRKWSALARVDAEGRVLDEGRMAGSPLIQPWIVPTSATTGMALFRWSMRAPGFVTYATTADAGVHWSAVSSTGLPHRDSAVTAARLDDGSLIAIYNNAPGDRRQLAIVRSADGGATWSAPYAIENDHGPSYDGAIRREYSYPFLVVTHDGRFHVVYTYQRKLIRHATFNAAWVKATLR